MTRMLVSLAKFAIIIALVAMIAPVAARQPLAQAEQTANVTLSGAEEVPDPGDPDGSGTTVVTFRTGTGEICWDIKVAGITLPSVGAHIHEGAKGVAGPVVVPFSPPDANGVATGCTKPDAALMQRIMQTPQNFYVNVHTPDFPAGAIRGQLMMESTAQPMLPSTGADQTWLLVLAGCALLAITIGVRLTRRGRRATPR